MIIKKILLFISIYFIFKIYTFYNIEKNNNISTVLDLAHRGYASQNKESSIEAFKYAIAVKTDGLELDIRQTLDNVIVISHDKKLNGIEINKTLLSDLSHTLVTLKDILSLAKETQTSLWIEIKDSDLYPKIINNMLSLLKEKNYEKNVVIQSFNMKDLLYIHTQKKNIKLLKLSLYYMNTSFPKYLDYIGLPLYDSILEPNAIKSLQKQGFKVIFWRESFLFENKYILNQLIKIGANGFMLNKPLNSF